jgi:hypothetical protein
VDPLVRALGATRATWNSAVTFELPCIGRCARPRIQHDRQRFRAFRLHGRRPLAAT